MTTKVNPSYAELNAVLDRVAQHPSAVAEVTEPQLLGLQRRWVTALSARLDEAIEFAGAVPMVDAVAISWRALADQHRTLREVLDARAADSPALAGALAAEHRMLAVGAGIAGLDAPAEEARRLGQACYELIRSGRTELTDDLARELTLA